MKVDLLGIDIQNDFCDPSGALYVQGAKEDSERLATMIRRLGKKISGIHLTLDTHSWLDIAHPAFWVDSTGKHPAPYTLITEDDVKNGKFRTYSPAWAKRAMKYVESLSANGRYPLVIWPPHCLIGSWGHSIIPCVYNVVLDWQKETYKMVDFVTKGSNPWTEHYSAVVADVPDPDDPTTMLNIGLIQTLENADIVLITGQALSHCLKFTTEDIANNFGVDNIKKLILLDDTTSSVTGFESNGKDFVTDMMKRGMKIEKSTEVLK